MRWYNDVLADVVRTEPPQVHLLRWSEWLCPNGNFLREVDGQTLRPDGLHFQHTVVPLVWHWLTPRLNATVRPNPA